MRLFYIVHVDDNLTFSQQVRESLTSATTVVHSFRTGAQAREMVERGDCDVLIVDSSGFEFAAEARQRSLVERIVVLSGSPENATFLPSLSLRKLDGCRDQLKAFLADAHAAVVGDQWASRRTRRDIFATLSDADRIKYAGKVLVLAGAPEQIVFAGESLAEAEGFVRGSEQNSTWRLVQSPPAVKLCLSDLQEG